MSGHDPNSEDMEQDIEPAMIDADEGEEVAQDEDAGMDSGEDDIVDGNQQEIHMQNDSAAHFDFHEDSIFSIAQHPKLSSIVATGAGDDKGYIFCIPTDGSNQAKPAYHNKPRDSLKPLATLSGHTDSVNALAFTLPAGEYLLSAGLDGKLFAWKDSSSDQSGSAWAGIGSVREVDEIEWLAPCPNPSMANAVALGGSDGSVWIFKVDQSDESAPLSFVNSFFLHTGRCTAGAWTPDGTLLATVDEEGSFYVWDAFGDAAAAGMVDPPGGNTVVGLNTSDERFKVEGGLFSVAVSPTGTIAAVGGAEGHIRIVGLPRITSHPSATAGIKGGAGAKVKAGGSKQDSGPKGGEVSAGQAGQILASIQAQSESVETLAFSHNPAIPLLAAGSVDGSIAFFDTKNNFSMRKHLKGAHEDQAVVKVDFAGFTGSQAWTLTSCGLDGVVRRWDSRGGASVTSNQMCGEYRGHRGGGEGGGVLGFVQGGGDGRFIVTAGDE